MAAPYQNYDTGTFLGDLVTRPEFLSYIQEEIYQQCKFIQSGVLVRNSALDAKAGGVKVQVPFFRPIDPTEERIESNDTWGTSGQGYLTPQKITASSQYMPILHRGFSYAVDDLSKLGSGADPMAAIRSQLGRAINKLRTRTLVAQLEGLFGAALTANVVDKVGAATGAATEAQFISAASFIQAKAKLGERADELTTLVVHPNVYFYLQQIGALTFSTSALSTGGSVTWGGGGVGLRSTDVPFFMGARVVVDSMLPVDANGANPDKYTCYLLGGGSVAEGEQQGLRLAAERNILSFQDVIAVDYHYGLHVMGTSYSGADNPNNTTLQTAGSWTLAYSNANMVDAVKLIVSTPFT
ncbi:MAG: major capsid protein [Vulcanococcus sp.]